MKAFNFSNISTEIKNRNYTINDINNIKNKNQSTVATLKNKINRLIRLQNSNLKEIRRLETYKEQVKLQNTKIIQLEKNQNNSEKIIKSKNKKLQELNNQFIQYRDTTKKKISTVEKSHNSIKLDLHNHVNVISKKMKKHLAIYEQKIILINKKIREKDQNTIKIRKLLEDTVTNHNQQKKRINSENKYIKKNYQNPAYRINKF